MSIRLRQTLGSDLDFVLNAERFDENSKFVIVWTYEQHKQALSSKDLLHLIVERCADNKPIGYIILVARYSFHAEKRIPDSSKLVRCILFKPSLVSSLEQSPYSRCDQN